MFCNPHRLKQLIIFCCGKDRLDKSKHMFNTKENSLGIKAVPFWLQIRIYSSNSLKGMKSLYLNLYHILASGILPQIACRVWIRVLSSLLCKLPCKRLREGKGISHGLVMPASHHMLMPHLCTLSELDLRLISSACRKQLCNSYREEDADSMYPTPQKEEAIAAAISTPPSISK